MSDRRSAVARVDLSSERALILDPSGRPIRSESVSGQRPFSPGEPQAPALPGQTPRGLIPRVGQNLNLTPRTGWRGRTLGAFEELKVLSAFDLVRIAIEDVKGQIIGMEWDVQPRKEFKNDPEAKAEADRARRFVDMPDPLARLDFEGWLSQAIEEMLVTDALTLYPHRTVNGEPIGLEQIDGATIIPLVDDRGRPPLPPAPAYQQIVYGRPETEFLLDEIWYSPFTRRVDNPYGHPPTEQVIITVNLAIRSSLYDLSYYTTGTLPDALFSFPAGWSSEQIAEYEEGWNLMREGRITSGGLGFLPEGQYIETKKREWRYDFLEWLGRVIAWAFGVSPLPIMRLIGRATAEALESSFAESGVRNRAKFIARRFNRYIQQELGLTRVEFVWQVDQTEDAAIAYQRNVALISAGAKTPDEVRKEYGLDPYAGGIGAKPFVLGAAPMLLEDAIRPIAVQTDAATLPASAGAAVTGNGRASEASRSGEGEAGPADDGAAVDPLADALTLWRRVSLDRMKAGRRFRAFTSDAIPDVMSAMIQARLEKAATADDVRVAFDLGPLKKKPPNPTSRRSENRDADSLTPCPTGSTGTGGA